MIMLLLGLFSLLLVANALAAGGYQITWWTVDNGGGNSQSAGGQYALHGTIGQLDAASLSGGRYILQGGFWQRINAVIHEFLIHLPLVIR